MRTHKLLAAGAAVVTLGILLAAVMAADTKSPRDDMDKLAEIAGKTPGDLQKKADAWVKANSDTGLDDVMNLLKKRSKDNPDAWGVGPKPTNQMDDGIEVRIQNYAKKAPSKDSLTKEKADLIQAITAPRPSPPSPSPRSRPRRKAIRTPRIGRNTPIAWSRAAMTWPRPSSPAIPRQSKPLLPISIAACTDCHAKFRD